MNPRTDPWGEAFTSLHPLRMTPSKKSQRNEATATQDTKAEAADKKLPIKVIRVEDVSVSIFAHERETNGVQRVNYSCSFTRSYKDSAGEWKRTQWFGLDELGRVVSCAQQAHEYLTSQASPGAERKA